MQKKLSDQQCQDIAQRLKQARKKLGLKQFEVAKKIGISYSHYSKIEVGSGNPSRELLRELAAFFCVSLDWLLAGSDKCDDVSQTCRKPIDYNIIDREQFIQEVAEMAGDDEVMAAAKQLQKVLNVTLGKALDILLRERKNNNRGNNHE